MTGRPGTTGVVHVVVGPARHGVVRHATTLLGTPALAADGVHRAVDPHGLVDLPARWEARTGRRPDLLHMHLTDHLLAPDVAGCAAVVRALAEQVPVSLTLHDLPQPEDGPDRYPRRAAGYRAMADVAVGVVVASPHERRLLQACTLPGGAVGRSGPVKVVPLPLDVRPGRNAAAGRRTSPVAPGAAHLVVFGFVYPGKGHVEALEAAAVLAREAPGGCTAAGRPGVLALGEASPGHEDLVADHLRLAQRLGVPFEVSGHLPDDRLDERLRAAGVPVAPRRDPSASGSIGSWLTAGRRPLAPAGPWTDDLEERCPGALVRYGTGTAFPTLADAARAALRDPATTWLTGAERLGPGAVRCGELYAVHLRRWVSAARADVA